jgi:hypothetical protein
MRARVMRVMRDMTAMRVMRIVRVVARRQRCVLAHPERQQRESDCASMLAFARRRCGSSDARRRAQGHSSNRRAQRKYWRPPHAKPAGVVGISIGTAHGSPSHMCCRADSLVGRARPRRSAPNAPAACLSPRG